MALYSKKTMDLMYIYVYIWNSVYIKKLALLIASYVEVL